MSEKESRTVRVDNKTMAVYPSSGVRPPKHRCPPAIRKCKEENH